VAYQEVTSYTSPSMIIPAVIRPVGAPPLPQGRTRESWRQRQRQRPWVLSVMLSWTHPPPDGGRGRRG